jgi:hypothetical protein
MGWCHGKARTEITQCDMSFDFLHFLAHDMILWASAHTGTTT